MIIGQLCVRPHADGLTQRLADWSHWHRAGRLSAKYYGAVDTLCATIWYLYVALYFPIEAMFTKRDTMSYSA